MMFAWNPRPSPTCEKARLMFEIAESPNSAILGGSPDGSWGRTRRSHPDRKKIYQCMRGDEVLASLDKPLEDFVTKSEQGALRFVVP